MLHKSRPKQYRDHFEINCLESTFKKDQMTDKPRPCDMDLADKSLVCSTTASFELAFHPMG